MAIHHSVVLRHKLRTVIIALTAYHGYHGLNPFAHYAHDRSNLIGNRVPSRYASVARSFALDYCRSQTSTSRETACTAIGAGQHLKDFSYFGIFFHLEFLGGQSQEPAEHKARRTQGHNCTQHLCSSSLKQVAEQT
jgi:hypothetical protein